MQVRVISDARGSAEDKALHHFESDRPEAVLVLRRHTVEKMLQKLAGQLASVDEASLMNLWESYYKRVSQFQPTRTWERDLLILGMIQTVRWKNQLFNSKWKEARTVPSVRETSQVQEADPKETDADQSSREIGRVIRFQPKDDEREE